MQLAIQAWKKEPVMTSLTRLACRHCVCSDVDRRPVVCESPERGVWTSTSVLLYIAVVCNWPGHAYKVVPSPYCSPTHDQRGSTMLLGLIVSTDRIKRMMYAPYKRARFRNMNVNAGRLSSSTSNAFPRTVHRRNVDSPHDPAGSIWGASPG